MSSVRQLCTFQVDGVLFGVDVMQVQEVIRYQEMTPVPLAPPVVSGLINLRGQIVTALDMRVRMGVPPRVSEDGSINVVVRCDGEIVSLLVDEIGDVLEVEESLYERPPEVLSAGARSLIEGVYKTSPQLLLVLDTKRATRIEMNQPAKETR